MEELVDLGAVLGAGIEIPKSSPKIAVTRPRSSAPTGGTGFRSRRGNDEATSPALSAGEGRASSPRSAQNQTGTSNPIPAGVKRPRPKSSSATPSILFNRSVDSSRGMDIDFDVDIDIDIDDRKVDSVSVAGRQKVVGSGGGTYDRNQASNRNNNRNGSINKESNYNTDLIEEDNEDDDFNEMTQKSTVLVSTNKPLATSNGNENRPVYKPTRPRPRSSAGYKTAGDNKSSLVKMSVTAGDVTIKDSKSKGRPSSGNFYFRPSSGVSSTNPNNLTNE